MAPLAVDGLLPASAGPETAAGHSAYAQALPESPSAARQVEQHQREARWGLLLAAFAGILLLATVAVAYVIVSKHAAPSKNALVENHAEPPSIVVPESTWHDPISTVEAVPQARSTNTITSTPDPAPPKSTNVAPTSSPTHPPAPASSPSRSSPPTAPPPTIIREEAQALIKALETAKAALAEQNFKLADAQLANAESLARLPKHREVVARLREVAGYVKQFRQAVAAAVQGMQAGESFKVGNSTQVAFVEGSADKVVLRIAGMNRTYPLNNMPPELALAIADFKLAASDPSSRVAKGAYLLVHKQADSIERQKAMALWQEAQRLGTNVSHLMPFLNDNYADLLKDVPAE